MNNALRKLLFVGFLFASSGICARADLASIDVSAKEKASGKVVYKGKTGAGGKFATGTLAPGSYIFEFSSKDGTGFQVALAGAKSARQAKNRASGLAFDVEVGPAAKVSGQVTPTQATAAQASTKGNAKVRIINGKRYVWARGEIGSHMGGRWVLEEDAVAASKGEGRNSAEMLRDIQDLGSQGAASGR